MYTLFLLLLGHVSLCRGLYEERKLYEGPGISSDHDNRLGDRDPRINLIDGGNGNTRTLKEFNASAVRCVATINLFSHAISPILTKQQVSKTYQGPG